VVVEEDTKAEGEAEGGFMVVMVRTKYLAQIKPLRSLILRNRNFFMSLAAAPPVPVRPASPLPPGVPTGPRNQNKYKDRDGNAPAVDGLDYGGGKEGMGRRTPSGEPEERISSR